MMNDFIKNRFSWTMAAKVCCPLAPAKKEIDLEVKFQRNEVKVLSRYITLKCLIFLRKKLDSKYLMPFIVSSST
jgi:hypothetical protein